MPQEPWTVLRLINWTKEYFEKNQVDSPRLATEVLLAHSLKCQRIQLYTRFDYTPSADETASFKGLVQRAVKHEPIAYLVGVKEFYSLPFRVTADVLIPRQETELLVAQAIEHLQKIGPLGVVWDCCTGSGCVAVAIASRVKDCNVLATDISPAAVAVAAENAKLNKVDDRVKTAVADLLTLPADLTPQAGADWHTFDVITANPPYIVEGGEVSSEVNHEPPLALYAGKSGLELITRVITDAPARLRDNGVLVMEFGYDQADAVRELLVANGHFKEPRILRDHQELERAVVARKK
ncbi:MAG: peptide chain release factor N(5)-glutamine methyltransferase [Phycisphaerae bacterium]|nr:peptide chain release factor N(5)-glutamine methyltransferase [Phycisphaerae bacterium]